MSYYEAMLRENSIVFNFSKVKNYYDVIQFKEKDDIEFAATCIDLKKTNIPIYPVPSSSLSSSVVGNTEIRHMQQQTQIQSETKYNFHRSITNFNVKSHPNINVINTLNEKQKDCIPMPDSKYKIVYHESGSGFTGRISCYFNNFDDISFHCDVCCSKTSVSIQKNTFSSCGHYVACNECRGRDIRRLLRCVECCKDILFSFPICSQDSNCVNNDIHDVFQTSVCYRCCKRLRKETCNEFCNRRKSPEYIQSRKDLKSKVMVLVRNPIHFSSSPPEFGTIRPCSHHSFCNIHNTVVRGHGKYTGCEQCKKEKKR